MPKQKQGPVTFVQGGLDAVVWNPRAGEPLAEFVKGLFTTDNQETITELHDLGYKTMADFGGVPPADGFAPPDRGPVIDTRQYDVRTAASEIQAAALIREKKNVARSMAKPEPEDAFGDPDDDGEEIEYIPPKRRAGKGKTSPKEKKAK